MMSSISSAGFSRKRSVLWLAFITTLSFGLTSSILSCSSSQSTAQKQLRISVGEIKEITLPNQGDGSMELIGSSDNQEVVEVSRQQLAPAVDTLNRDKTGSTVFQIKGITVGTTNVVFSRKSLGQSGSGEPMRTYRVQVSAK